MATLSLTLGGALTAQAAPTQTLDLSVYETGGLNGQYGWTQGSTDHDVELVENADYSAADVEAGRSIRVSNAETAKAVELRSPPVDPVGAPSTGAAANTFEASFSIASATGAFQEDLAVGVAISNDRESRTGGYVILSHSAGGLQVGAQWIAYDKTSANLNDWSSAWATAPGGGLVFDANVSHDIRLVSQFTDNETNTLSIFVDGVLALVVNNWVHYHEVAGTTATTGGNGIVDRLLIGSARSVPTATGVGFSTETESGSLLRTETRPTLDGQGFLFGGISYGALNTAPPLPTAPPVIAPVADPAPDAALAVPTTAIPVGTAFTVTASGFAPFENVSFAWYPSARFAGWFQADAAGVVTASITASEELPIGVNVLQATGETTGFVAAANVTIAAVTLPATGVAPSIAVVGAAALMAAGGLLLVARRPVRVAR